MKKMAEENLVEEMYSAYLVLAQEQIKIHI